MRNRACIFSLIMLLCACGTGVELEEIPFDPVFHDNSSKVWLIDQVITNGKNYAPIENENKDIIVFYESGNCMFQPLKSLGDIQGKKGRFSIFTSDSTMGIFFKNERWDFKVKTLKHNYIELTPLKGSDFQYSLVLISFPEI
jgi:hypothetical protein